MSNLQHRIASDPGEPMKCFLKNSTALSEAWRRNLALNKATEGDGGDGKILILYLYLGYGSKVLDSISFC